MENNSGKKGSFTLPGESGYEDLTLKLAKKWGADVIRDCDGTDLSDEITKAGYNIYSTLCVVRSDNEWAKKNMDKLQQNYLMSFPATSTSDNLEINILNGYFNKQFIIDEKSNPKEYWQVFDRTTGKEVPKEKWEYNNRIVTINNTIKWHKYTVNFLVFRIWEEISMYNHITNNWGDKEHLMSIDPIYEESQKHILGLLEKWLLNHPNTNVVRFTSMFYNFCWIWGEDPKLKHIYSDWGSYDFTVNPLSMKKFQDLKGYKIKSEDFINMGYHNSTHNPPTKIYLDWIDFVNSFVVEFGRKCIDLVHKYNKKAYVFYDDHWIGIEPYSKRFTDFNFDGIIKCVFSGFEARKCASVIDVKTHELRLHPYLFPTGLTGEATFKEGGNPDIDAKNFWINIRRALLRQPVDRIGLGGYLHLVEPFPKFIDYIEELTNEFRTIKDLHTNDRPHSANFKIGILNSWGSLRTWICSGHLHEHPEIELTNLLESLSGLPFDVEFLSFDDVLKNGISDDIKVLINAGKANSAWSGGVNWKNPKLVETISSWVASGGGLIGIGEPSAIQYSSQYFQLTNILGVEKETGNKIAFCKYNYNNSENQFILEDQVNIPIFKNNTENIYVTEKDVKVLLDKNNSPILTTNSFYNGRSVYLSGFTFSNENTRLIHKIICWVANREKEFEKWTCKNPNTECAYFPNKRILTVINNSDLEQSTSINTPENKKYSIYLKPYGIKIINI
ncbi:MAG: 1,3-beta-galactosyl-N-acetylhexosamine phosphorylase [Clostridiales bacterium]